MDINIDTRQRATIAQGYGAMFLLLLMMLATDLVELGMRGDFAGLATDPGTAGLWVLVVIACLNVLGQLSARHVQGRARWALFALTLAYTLFFMGHQLDHLLAGAGLDMHFLLDLAHHGTGVVATLAAWRLARQDTA